MLVCSICGGETFRDRAVIWDGLVAEWGISPDERAYIDRQQGTCCRTCGAPLRSIALAKSILAWARSPLVLDDFTRTLSARRLRVLELNKAGSLNPILARLPRHVLGEYPEVDMQRLSYGNGSFDLIVHSDTLEHVPDPHTALRECLRVLRPGGAMCFTVPIIVGRMTRSRAGLEPSYHGRPSATGDGATETTADMAVQTEYGADAWIGLMQAGFASVEVTAAEYPSALALIARKNTGKKPRRASLPKVGGAARRAVSRLLGRA